MDNTSVTRADFALEQQEVAAPPWGGRWLTSSAVLTDVQTVSPASELRHATGDDGQSDQKKKLFVGMAPKAAYEADYRPVFAPFGTIVDIYVIRDRNGFSKGCAFVKYDLVQSARCAIEALHDKYIMPGGFRTLVVAIADDRRGPHSTATSSTWQSIDPVGLPCLDSCRTIRGSFSGVEYSPSVSCCSSSGGVEFWPGHVSSVPGQKPASSPQAAYAIPAPSAPAAIPPSIPSSATMVPGVQYLFSDGSSPPHGTYVYYPCGLPASSSSCHQTAPMATNRVVGKPHRNLSVASTALDPTAAVWYDGGRESSHRTFASPTMGLAQNVQHDTVRGRERKDLYCAFERSNRGMGIISNPAEEGRRWAKQPVGPSGANLFVYYLPGSLSDADLATAFAPFGEVLSAKVYYDRDTGESKGFGFVSYTNPAHADAAIARMNGFFIGNKRLKVVRKRGQVSAQDNGGGSGCTITNHGYVGASACASSSVGGDSLSGIDGGDEGGTGGDGGGSYTSLFGKSLEREFFGPQDILGHQDTRPMSPLRYL